MPETVVWQPDTNPADLIGRAVEVLRAGGIVALPAEAAYQLVCSGLSTKTVQRLPVLAGEVLAVGVRTAAEAKMWAPGLSPVAQRLARRCWPGPLILATRSGIDHGLATSLPEPVRRSIGLPTGIHLRCSAHPLFIHLLRAFPAPLLLTPTRHRQAENVAADFADSALVIDAGQCSEPRGPTVVEVDEARWRVVRAGSIAEAELQRQAACLILFVCTGNTCRSPLAEALFKKQLADRLGCAAVDLPAKGFYVLSAGLAAMMGGTAADEARATAESFGSDLSQHRTCLLTPDLAADADFLLTMTRGHLEAMLDFFPYMATTPRLLDPAGQDLADPIGCEQEVYAVCGRQIWELLPPLVAEVVSCGGGQK